MDSWVALLQGCGGSLDFWYEALGCAYLRGFVFGLEVVYRSFAHRGVFWIAL